MRGEDSVLDLPAGLAAMATIEPLIVRDVLTCTLATPVCEAAAAMARRHVGSIIVMEGRKPVGIWTEKDAVRLDLMQPGIFDEPICRFMTCPLLTVLADAAPQDVAMTFRERHIRHLVVVDDNGELVGVVGQTDVVLNGGIDNFLGTTGVRSALFRAALTLPGATPLNQALTRMQETANEAAIILDQGRPWGILTERDVIRRIAERDTDIPVGQVASHPIVAINLTSSLIEAKRKLATTRFRHLAVIGDDGGSIGILTLSDILATVEFGYVRHLEEVLSTNRQLLAMTEEKVQVLAKAVEHSAALVAITDASGFFVYVNPSFEAVTGYSLAELKGKTPSVLNSRIQPRSYYEALWRDLTAGRTWKGDFCNRRKDGSLYWVRASISPVTNEQGEIVYYVGVEEDVTELVAKDEALRREKELFLGGMVVVFSWRAEAGWPVEYVSPNVVDLLGYSDQEFLSGRVPFIDVVFEEDRSRVEAEVNGYVAAGQDRYSQHYRIRTAAGIIRWVHDHTIVVRDLEGRAIGFRGYIMDVTEERIRDEQLQASEKRFRTIFERSAIGIAQVDLSGRLISANPAFLAMLGYTGDELLGLSWRDITFPEDLASCEELFHDLLAGRIETYSIEKRYIHKTGAQIWAHLVVSCERDPGGSPQFIVSMISDITERKRLQDEIIKRERKYHSIFSSAGSGIVRGQGGRILEANRAFAGMLGYEAAELVDRPWLDLAHPDDRDLSRRHIEKLRDRPVRFEKRYLRKDGGIVWARVAITTEGPEETEESGVVVAIVEDITALKIKDEEIRRRDEELKQRAAFLQTVMDAVPVPIFVKNADGRFTHCNDAFLKFTGVPKGGIAGATAGQLLGRGIEELSLETDKELLAGAPVADYQATLINADGEECSVIVHKATFGGGRNGVDGIIGVLVDITTLKNNETALKEASERLSRSNADLERFAYVVSHDLQEPLRMIISYLQLIEKRYGDLLDDKGRTFIEFAVDGGRRMRKMIHDLLDYSRLDRTGGAIETADLAECVHSALGNLKVAIAESGADIDVSPLPVVRVDRDQLSRVFQNIIGNAVKYRHPDRAPRISIDAESDERSVRVRITDNGRGIDPGQHSKVFQLFQRLHAPKDIEGTGVGLAICKRIIERHGGEIGLISADGQGATFWFTLPIGGAALA